MLIHPGASQEQRTSVPCVRSYVQRTHRQHRISNPFLASRFKGSKQGWLSASRPRCHIQVALTTLGPVFGHHNNRQRTLRRDPVSTVWPRYERTVSRTVETAVKCNAKSTWDKTHVVKKETARVGQNKKHSFRLVWGLQKWSFFRELSLCVLLCELEWRTRTYILTYFRQNCVL